MSRYYGGIKTVPELKALQDAASQEGKTAVGVTTGGGLYILEDGKSKKVTPDQAAAILETSQVEVEQLIKARGSYELRDLAFAEIEPDPAQTVTEPEAKEVVIQEPEVIQVEETEPVQEPGPASNDPDVVEVLGKIAGFVDKAEPIIKSLPVDHDSLIREVRGLRADLGRLINKLEKILLD